jgi:thiol-disulfide isomerase/thioredoxin
MDFIKKHWSNILFFGLLIFMFTPPGMPMRALLIKGVSYITSRVENLETPETERLTLQDYNWELSDANGRLFNFKEYKGKVILINNWATWCPPCVAEMPSLDRLYLAYKNNDQMVFLFVAHDKPDKVTRFIKQNNLHMSVVFMQSNPPQLLQSASIPTTYIIDKTGQIVVQKTGAADWDSGQVHRILDKLLK